VTAPRPGSLVAYAVLGATSWGVTIAGLLAANGHDVTILTRTDAEASGVSALRGLARIPELSLPSRVSAMAASEANAAFDGLVVAVPAQTVRANAAALGAFHGVPVLSAAKGIELGTGLRVSQVLAAGGWPEAKVAVLSGPNLAHEVARGLPAAAVVAAGAESEAERWQAALSGPMFRVYRSADVVGVELGGALKNVIAIAAGVAAGLDMGANAMAAIMTRGLAEMTRLGVALGADPLTFQGLAGVGDLAVTCYSPLSRNHRFGELLARGESPATAAALIGEAVEGAATAPVALALAKRLGVDMPIAAQVVAVLDGSASIHQAMQALLGRALTIERAG